MRSGRILAVLNVGRKKRKVTSPRMNEKQAREGRKASSSSSGIPLLDTNYLVL